LKPGPIAVKTTTVTTHGYKDGPSGRASGPQNFKLKSPYFKEATC